MAATQLLKSARAEFLSARDRDGSAQVDVALIKIKADIVVEAMGAAREVPHSSHSQQQLRVVQHRQLLV